jgi:hypothetical protein
VLFGIVFYLLRDSLFSKQNGWLIAWAMLVIVGIICPFGPAPGSVEGLIYTKLPIESQLGVSLIEVFTQSLLLSALTVYWVKNPQVRWLNWVLSLLFMVVLLLPLLGLLARQSTMPQQRSASLLIRKVFVLPAYDTLRLKVNHKAMNKRQRT